MKLTDRQLKAAVLKDMVNLLGSTNAGLYGIKPAFVANRYFTQLEKEKMSKYWEEITRGLGRRQYRLERL